MSEEKKSFSDDLELFDKKQQNQLDDIVLEKYEKKEKFKRAVIISGVAAAVFIIVVFLIKYFMDSSNTPQDSLIDEQITNQIEQTAKNNIDEEYEEIPVINEEKDSGNELNNVIEEIVHNKQPQTKNIDTTNSLVQKEQKSIHSSSKNLTPTNTKSQPHKKSKQQKSQQQKIKKSLAKSKQSRSKRVEAVTKGRYYIQVGAFMKYDPDKRFLSKIKSHGYEYKIKEFDKNGVKIKRVYIGPFADRSSAKKALASIKKTIAPGAFIVRL